MTARRRRSGARRSKTRRDGPRQREWLTPGVLSIGFASLFSDAGHELTTSVLPTFVVSVLRSSAGVLGLIEGVSDALLGLAQLIAGPFANDLRARRDIARGGYLVTAAATGAIGLAAAVWQAGLLRAVSWVARGSRSPARDSMLAAFVRPSQYGRAYGVERAGDNLGAVVGPLLAAWLVSAIGVRDTLYVAAGPGVLAAVAITVAARAARADDREDSESAVQARPRKLELRAVLRAGLARPAVTIGLFECGNCATTLLILRATDLLHVGTRSLASATTLAVVLYASNNLLGAVSALWGGHMIDLRGPRRAFGIGTLLFVAAYGIFAWGSHQWPLLLVAFVLAGAAIGLVEPAESALVATRLPERLRGSGFGLLGGLQCAGDLAASGILGLIWWLAGPTTAFIYAGCWMLAAFCANVVLMR